MPAGLTTNLSRVYMAEVMPMQIRGRGNAVATSLGNWVVSTIWNQVSPIAFGKIHWRFYLVFILFSKFSFPFRSEGVESEVETGYSYCFSPLDVCITIPTVFFFFKETKQKSLEEIDLLFGGRALGTLPENVEAKAAEAEMNKAEKTRDSYANVEHTENKV